MSAVAGTARRVRESTHRPLALYRDDGPLERLLGRLGRGIPGPPIFLIAVGATPLLALLAIRGEGASQGAVAAVIGVFVLAGGLTEGRRTLDRFRWLVAPLLRLVEYATLLWIGALAGGSSDAAAFALLCVLAFRHYDIVYRLRQQGASPPRWVGDLAGGWAGRLVGAWVLWAAGALPAGFFVAAGVLGTIFAVESAASWVRWASGRQPGAATTDDHVEEDGG